jgi:hypothetical protein
MDILVTTPKRAHKLASEEAEFVQKNPGAFWFRTIRGNPNVAVGDRVYYVDNGVITGYGIIFDIEHGTMQCEASGKDYHGTHLKQHKWVALKKRIPFRGFQGFRYVDTQPGLRVQLNNAENA